MFDTLRKSITRRLSLEQVARLDRHLRDDIGFGHLADPDRGDPILILTRGPFERYGV